MRMPLQVIPVLAIMALTGCASTGTTSSSLADVRAAVDRANAQMMAAMNSGRVADAMGLYSSDAVVLAANAPPMHGHQAIAGFWNAVAGMKMRNVKLTTEQLEVHGDVAIETGSYEMTLNPPGAPGDVNDRGKFLVVWKRQADGSWKIYRDMFSSNLPMH